MSNWCRGTATVILIASTGIAISGCRSSRSAFADKQDTAAKKDESIGDSLAVKKTDAAPVTLPLVPAANAGEWQGPFPWRPEMVQDKFVAVHMHVLPNGKVLAWSHDGDDAPMHSVTHNAYVWDPATGLFEHVPNLNYNIFCSGHAFMPDGRLLVAGGHGGYPEANKVIGVKSSAMFDFRTNQWTSGPDMNAGRWYPTVLPLPSGESLVVSGSDEQSKTNVLPQVLTKSGTWRTLSHASIAAYPELYPFLHVAPSGEVFQSGPSPNTYYLYTGGNGNLKPGPARPGGMRIYGTAVQYDRGKVLVLGGWKAPEAHTVLATAETIDLAAKVPVWTATNSMKHPRYHVNATLLPDGQVLVTGGTSFHGTDDSYTELSQAVYEAELWNPTTQIWTVLSSMKVPRLYHSSAVLLPDGRVLSAGGGLPLSPGEPPNGDHQNMEIFSPPYLFKGPRPIIKAAPDRAKFKSGFDVRTLGAQNIGTVTLVGLSSVTHSLNMNQRFARLKFQRTKQGLRVSAPNNGNELPPGYYWLFILNRQGVPSVGKSIKIY